MRELQDIITASIEEKLQDLIPPSEAINNAQSDVGLTAEALIRRAHSDDDYVPAAALIYSNVEKNLIYARKLMHENTCFVIPYKDYLHLADSAKIGDRYLLKRFNPETETHETFSPRVIESDENGIPITVEMPPLVRFLKAGLEPIEAKKAADYWTVLNKIRHKSPNNEAYLQRYFDEFAVSKQEYFMQVLSFFKDCGLYTKE